MVARRAHNPEVGGSSPPSATIKTAEIARFQGFFLFLPFVIFGLLSYLEPVLLAFASIALGERVEGAEWLTYIPIWLAVMLLVVEGVIYKKKKKAQAANLKMNLREVNKRLNSEK